MSAQEPPVSYLDAILDERESNEYAMEGHGLNCLSPTDRPMGEAMHRLSVEATSKARAELAALRAERDALRRALADLHAITPEEDRKWLAEAAYWETMYREAADDAARIRGSYGKGT